MSQEEKHTLEELLFSAISNCSENVELQQSSGSISVGELDHDVIDNGDSRINRIDEVDHGLKQSEESVMDEDSTVVDLTVGREDLIEKLESTYRDVRGKLARNGVSINPIDGGVKVSPMNVRFTFLPSEGTSIRNVRSRQMIWQYG